VVGRKRRLDVREDKERVKILQKITLRDERCGGGVRKGRRRSVALASTAAKELTVRR
jgi:hypothetical protein